jgi:hypothetical protein
VDFDRIFATRFKIAFVEFAGVIETFLFFSTPSKLIVESFWECTIFARSIGFRFEKNHISSDSYFYKASLVLPGIHTSLCEGGVLHLGNRGRSYSQSKQFDRGRHTGKRGRSRRPYHRVRGHARLSGHLHLCERAQPLHRCYADGRTVVLVGARGFGIAIACAGNLATALVGTPGFEALPAYASGAAIVVMEAYGFILAIACVPRLQKERWRRSCSAFACAVGITNVFASARGFSTVPACNGSIATAIAEACGFILTIARTRSRHFIPHGIDIATRRTVSLLHRHWCAVEATNLYSNKTPVKDRNWSGLPTYNRCYQFLRSAPTLREVQSFVHLRGSVRKSRTRDVITSCSTSFTRSLY